MNEIDIFDVHASFCGIFASPIRLKIMWMLRDGEKTVSELAKELDIPIANISQHLRIMRDQGAVITKREGRTIFYMISNKKFLKGAQLIREGIMEVIEKKGLLMSMPAGSPKRNISS